MALRLIIGPANAGKTEAVYARLRECASEARSAALLLPSGPDVSRATDDLVERATIGLRIQKFDDFLDQLWYTRGDGRRIITPAQRSAILEGLASTATTQLTCTDRGLARSLSTIVKRAAESGHIRPFVRETGSITDVLIRCALDYARMIEHAGLVERQEAHRSALSQIGPADVPNLIVVNRFTSLTVSQEAFLLAASGITEVLIGLTYSSAVPGTAAARRLVERLVTAGAVLDEQIAYTQGSPELDNIARVFGQAGRGGAQDRGAMILSEAWGEAAEAARIVREVQDARAVGIEPEEIAITFRDVEPHLHELRAAFEEAEIAAEFDACLPFGSTGLGRIILALLDLPSGGLSLGQVMDVLRSPFAPGGNDTLDELDAWARRTRTGDIESISRWCRSRAPETARFLREVDRACRDVVSAGAETRWYRLVSGMLRHAYPAIVTTDPFCLADFSAAKTLIEAQRGLLELRDRAISARTLASALRDSQVILRPANREGSVQVMGVERIRGRRYRCVIVGGLQAGEFPRRSVEDALSAPEVLRALVDAGIDLGARGGTAEERLLYYQAITRASERLVLSWQSHDEEGRPARPSTFVEETLDLYRDPTTGTYFGEKPPHHVLGLDAHGAHAAGPHTCRRTLRRIAAGDSLDAPSEVLEARRRSVRTRGSRDSACVARDASDREAFSASEIETYLQCPYRWFIERLVRPGELDETLDAAATGRAAHEIMARFYDDFIAQTGERRVMCESLDTARAIHTRIASAVIGGARAGTTAEEAALRAVVAKTWKLIEADATMLSGMEPAYREWSFGLEGDDEPELFGDFALRGRVDRIDVSDDQLIITDYKSGTVDAKRAVGAFPAEGLVQLPLYAAVARRRLGLEIAGAVYRPLSGGKPRGFILPGLAGQDFTRTDVCELERIEAVIGAAVEMSAEAVHGMRSGDVTARPRNASCPSYCGARGFCAEWRPGRG